jgi:hypothetical protein
LRYQDGGAEQRIEDLLHVAAERIGLAVEPEVEVALQHLVVPRLVGDLRRLEELGVLALDAVHQLAAQQHGAVLALHQGREPPARDPAVELDPVGRDMPSQKRVPWRSTRSSAISPPSPSSGTLQAMSRAAFHWSILACS